MKKQAYLIIDHKIEQLSFLIDLLDYEYHDIFIHIDKKSNIKKFNEFKQYLSDTKFRSNIILSDRISVYWGDYTQIEAEILLLKTAYKFSDYEYYHIISGEDLPIVNKELIYKFFNNNKNKIFISEISKDIFLKNNVYNRVKYNYLLTKLSKRSFNSSILTRMIIFFRKLEIMLYEKLNIDKFIRHNVELGYASNWVSIDTFTTKLVLENEKYIKKIFKNKLLADELFLPTLINKFNLHYKVYSKDKITDSYDDIQGNLRYINWWDGSPHVWTNSEYDKQQLIYAVKRGHLFSRKFDLKKYPELKKFIQILNIK